jgi:hypothetical protein
VVQELTAVIQGFQQINYAGTKDFGSIPLSLQITIKGLAPLDLLIMEMELIVLPRKELKEYLLRHKPSRLIQLIHAFYYILKIDEAG